MKDKPLLVLDFDGVICDSLDECFVSSWTAYHTIFAATAPHKVSITLRDDFSRLRPFIRSGEDYVLIQEILARGMDVRDQEGFDAHIEAAGPQRMKLFKELFARARSELLEKDKGFWMSLNRIYPHIRALFVRLPQSTPIAILSTKTPFFIQEILAYAEIRFAPENIHECKARDKLSRSEALRAVGDFPRAVLIDDQIDSLLGNTHPAVQPFLASWGYVKPEWLTDSHGVPIMTPRDLTLFAEREYLS